MLKRILFFTKPYQLRLENSQLIVEDKSSRNVVDSIPIEDIGHVILEHPQITITMPSLNALSDNNVAVIFCGDNRMPKSMLMHLDSNSTMSETYKAQLSASEPLKKQLWKQTIEAKIRNQSALLCKLSKNGDRLKPLYKNVKSADSDNREGVAAKIYWQELFGKDFVRSREGCYPNNLLNYGYSILRAAVARALMGSGLLPAVGIFHRNRYNAFPLADDIMEPYRPYVDEIVYGLYERNIPLDKDSKAILLRLLYSDVVFENIRRPLEIGLTITTSSLAHCFKGTKKKISYPLII